MTQSTEKPQMRKIMPIIATETDGKSYQSHRYYHDTGPNTGIEYDQNNPICEWKERGENGHGKRPINLKKMADTISCHESLFKYFLDGSRQTYKIDDISYGNVVYPVIAGQIGVGCCTRENREIKIEPDLFQRKLVIALPEALSADGWDLDIRLENLKRKINSDSLLQRFGINIDLVVKYSTRQNDISYENRGIAMIQSHMIEMEKDMVSTLVSKQKLNQESYLIKDGSIEYQQVSNKLRDRDRNDLTNKKILNNYKYVIGVSKSFDPTKCKTKDGGTNSDVIANLKPFERTPASMYCSKQAGDIWFVIWYVRIRDAKYSSNVFDGVLKVEKILIDRDGAGSPPPMDSDLIDHITANLLNERNPVCYGKDPRWANHIYPIYLTESYIKSKYLSHNMFMELF